jgi:hypothetical protein
MLRTGVAVSEACALVEGLVRAEAGVGCGSTEPGFLSPTTEIRPVENPIARVRGDQTLVSPAGHEGDGRFAEAVRLNREHWVQAGRPISAETLRKRLRLGADTSRAWSRIIRAADRAAVCRSG